MKLSESIKLVRAFNGVYAREVWDEETQDWVRIPTIIEQEPVRDDSAQSSVNA